jgi:hypothetical protein
MTEVPEPPLPVILKVQVPAGVPLGRAGGKGWGQAVHTNIATAKLTALMKFAIGRFLIRRENNIGTRNNSSADIPTGPRLRVIWGGIGVAAVWVLGFVVTISVA